MSSQSSLYKEVLELKTTLEVLESERRNLLQHFNIQEDNYAATFKSYVEKLGSLLKEQENQIEDLSREKSRLESRVSLLEAKLWSEDFPASSQSSQWMNENKLNSLFFGVIINVSYYLPFPSILFLSK